MAPPNLVHDQFRQVKIHTAKCDFCDRNNKDIIRQCTTCALNFCTPCWLQRGQDGTHIMNDGDRGYAATVALGAKAQSKLKLKAEMVEKSKSPSPLQTRRRVRRRRVVIEESEDEEMGGVAESSEPSIVDVDEVQAGREQRLSERRRGKLPEPLIEEPASPSTAGPSNQNSAAETNFSDRGFGTDGDTAEAADSLLALAAGSDSPVNGSGLHFRDAKSLGDARSTDISRNSRTRDKTSSATSTNRTYSRASGPHTVVHHQEARRPSSLFIPRPRGSDIPNTPAFTPANPTWRSTPAPSSAALLSSLFPEAYDYDEHGNTLPWPATAATEPMYTGAGNLFSDDADAAYNAYFHTSAGANPGTAAENVRGQGSGFLQNRDWVVPDDEDDDMEEGEIKEGGGDGGRSSAR
ncbi:MAG: hypothetical protein Q9191_002362 [Dirinaria sp. TL-2023a]